MTTALALPPTLALIAAHLRTALTELGALTWSAGTADACCEHHTYTGDDRLEGTADHAVAGELAWAWVTTAMETSAAPADPVARHTLTRHTVDALCRALTDPGSAAATDAAVLAWAHTADNGLDAAAILEKLRPELAQDNSDIGVPCAPADAHVALRLGAGPTLWVRRLNATELTTVLTLPT